MTRPVRKELTIYDITRELAANTGLTIPQARQMTFALIRIIKEALLQGQPVKIWEFGRFGFRMWTGRTWKYNPNNPHGPKRDVFTPSKLCLKFEVAGNMKRAVDKIPISHAIFRKPAPRGAKRPPRKISISL